MVPKAELVMLPLGAEKCGVLVALWPSARTSSLKRSATTNSRLIEASRFFVPGPRRMSYPALPMRAFSFHETEDEPGETIDLAMLAHGDPRRGEPK